MAANNKNNGRTVTMHLRDDVREDTFRRDRPRPRRLCLCLGRRGCGVEDVHRREHSQKSSKNNSHRR